MLLAIFIRTLDSVIKAFVWDEMHESIKDHICIQDFKENKF